MCCQGEANNLSTGLDENGVCVCACACACACVATWDSTNSERETANMCSAGNIRVQSSNLVKLFVNESILMTKMIFLL